ncbi:uncharacterized protein E0L32_010639 [Thyridium curvatum]|uniref:Ribosome biogenesis protein NOP53 n=1 Tax=Thyridium curvatum TaxID=1093900 RepID=A0A507ARX7_9PEZI|nr:uncharacterized protein E0L32_010639 [Thyridium curvatum]TPX07641.1 hypothetical protein E0L32_010639 [Thyridium curvatum]
MPVLQPLAGSPDAPSQYKQPSRKGKKAWRKNVDVSEVEKGLEERNEQIIKGGLVAEKPSADLFTLDTVGDVAITKKHTKHAAARKGLKADEIIAARSAVPAVSLRKRPGESSSSINGKVSDGILPAKRQRTGTYVTHKELVRLRKVADGHHESTVAVADATYDPWDAAPDRQLAREHDEAFSFLPKRQAAKPPRTLRQEPVSLAANGRPVPAVARPSGGYSYNPAFHDYEARFVAEGEKALEAERKRLAEEEADRLRREAAARSAAEAEAAEARADLSEWDEDSAWEGFESGGEELAGRSAKRPQRKTQAQRNRIKRRKEEERRLRHEAAQRRKDEQAARIKAIAREVAEREETRTLSRIELDSDADGDGDDNQQEGKIKLRRRPLGKYKVPEGDLELVLPDELQDSLRRLKPEGNLVSDMYLNKARAGKVVFGKHRAFAKQARTKLTEKWTHKDFRL